MIILALAMLLTILIGMYLGWWSLMREEEEYKQNAGNDFMNVPHRTISDRNEQARSTLRRPAADPQSLSDSEHGGEHAPPLPHSSIH